jgi:hypothetical protein
VAYKFQDSIQRGIIYLAKSDEAVSSSDYAHGERASTLSSRLTKRCILSLSSSFFNYKKLPTDDQLLEETKKIMASNELFGDYRDEIGAINSLDEKSIDNQEYYLDLVEEFAKEQAVKDAILKSVDHLKKKNFGAIEEEVRKCVFCKQKCGPWN